MNEIVSKRTLLSKVFQKDAKRVYRFHTDHVHFDNGEGLVDIDKEIVTKGNKLTTKATGFDLEISKKSKAGESPLVFKSKEIEYGLVPRGLRWGSKEVVYQEIGEVTVKNKKVSAEFENAFGESDLVFETINTGVRKIVKINKELEIPENETYLEVGFELLIAGDHDFYYQDLSNIEEVEKIRKNLLKIDNERRTLEKDKQFSKARELYTQQLKLEDELHFAMVSKWDKQSDIRFSGEFQIRKGDDVVFGRVPYVWDSEFKTSGIEVELRNRNGKLYFVKLIPTDFLKEAVYPVQTDATTSYYSGSGSGTIANSNANWTTCRNATDGNSTTVNPSTDQTGLQARYTGVVYIINRSFYPTDTSGIEDTDTIDSASLFLRHSSNTVTNAYEVDIVASSQASTSTLVNADYDQVGSTVFGSASYSVGYNEYVLDSNGLAEISVTGVTKLGARLSLDTDNSTPTGNNWVVTRYPAYAGTSSDPYLEVVTTPNVTFIPQVIMF